MFLEHARLVIERSLRCGGFPKVRLLFFKQLKFFRRNALSRGDFHSSRRVRDCWHGSCFTSLHVFASCIRLALARSRRMAQAWTESDALLEIHFGLKGETLDVDFGNV